MDKNPACAKHQASGIEVFIGAQDDPAVLGAIFEKYGKVDVLLDDGSHQMSDLEATFTFCYERLEPHGIYVVEDLHTCYWPEYGGGLKRQGTFIEFVKSKLDELNAVHLPGECAPSTFTLSTNAICCYDSMVVFERRPQAKRQAIITDSMEGKSAAPKS